MDGILTNLLDEMQRRRDTHLPIFSVPDKYDSVQEPEAAPLHPACGHPLNGDFTYVKDKYLVRRQTHVGYGVGDSTHKCRHCSPENERIRRLYQADKDLAMLFPDANLPDYGKLWSFDDFPQNDPRRDALTAASVATIINDSLALLRRGETGISLFVHGKPGTGKTSVAVSALKAYMQEGYAGAFLAIRNYMDLLHKSYQKEASPELRRVQDLISSIPVLVADDVGSEDPTPWSTGKIFDIVELRGHAGLVTIITSNNGLSGLRKYWRRLQDPEVQQQSGRIIRRIQERFKIIEMVGEEEEECQ